MTPPLEDGWQRRAACRGPQAKVFFAPGQPERKDERSERERMAKDPDLRNRVNIPRSVIPAVTHVDYSARLQTVDEDRNPRLAALLAAFQRRTGCPVLVNTSFNVRGEPIVCSPEDAYRCLLATEMDALVLEDVIVFKKDLADKVDAAAVSLDGHRALSGCFDGSVYLWDLDTGKQLLKFHGHEGAVKSVAIHSNGRDIVSAGADATIRLWQLPNDVPENTTR